MVVNFGALEKVYLCQCMEHREAYWGVNGAGVAIDLDGSEAGTVRQALGSR